jgi:hypothetical protein
MPNDVIIVIPTYWTWPSGQANEPVETFYDHPTPVDGASTLPRLLESLTALEGAAFSVLVLTAATHPDVEQAAASTVERLIAPFRSHYPITQATESDAALIRKSHPDLAQHVQMHRYAGVRNLQLLLPHILRAKVVLALDDDEVVAPDYLKTALHFVGQEHEGQRVLGLAGFYLDAGGNISEAELPRTGPRIGNTYLDKFAIMSEGSLALQAEPGRLVLTPVAFGGNMVFHCDLFTQIGFDPGITRGEDIDYLINARMAGFNFWLDKMLVITHLPPHHYNLPPYVRMVEDVRRFLYEKEKLRLAVEQGIHTPTLAELSPYPGYFLTDDAANQAQSALETNVTPELAQSYGAPADIVALAQERARQLAPDYFEFAQTWPRLMEAVTEDSALSEHFAARI